MRINTFSFIFQSVTDISGFLRLELGSASGGVRSVKQPRTHFDHFVLFKNKRILQPVENDQFMINDDFNETNMRRDKDERH